MKYALIINDIVDTISLEPQDHPWIEVSDDVFAGFVQNQDGSFTNATPETKPDTSITFAQLMIGLVTEGWITREEGESWLQGILPAQVRLLISSLPEEQQFIAIARATRPSVVMRNDPLVDALSALQQKTPEDIDQFFITYSGV